MLGTLQRAWGALYMARGWRSSRKSCGTKSNPLLEPRLADKSTRTPSTVCERGPTAADTILEWQVCQKRIASTTPRDLCLTFTSYLH